MPSLLFGGVAHPSPRDCHGHPADMTAAEIRTDSLGNACEFNQNAPVLVEHSGNPVGVVYHSWPDAQGLMRVGGRIDDPTAAEMVRSGKMRGLSLGTSVNEVPDGIMRTTDELSICRQPARPGCYIDEINGATVARRFKFHASGERYKCASPCTVPIAPRTTPRRA